MTVATFPSWGGREREKDPLNNKDLSYVSLIPSFNTAQWFCVVFLQCNFRKSSQRLTWGMVNVRPRLITGHTLSRSPVQHDLRVEGGRTTSSGSSAAETVISPVFTHVGQTKKMMSLK